MRTYSISLSDANILSSFQLTREYQPPILGIPSSFVSQEVLAAHVEQMATKCIQRTLRPRAKNCMDSHVTRAGDKVWVWYASGRGNEQYKLEPAKVVATHPRYVEARKMNIGMEAKGPIMKAAYEDMRLAPQSDIAIDIMELELEHEGEMDISVNLRVPATGIMIASKSTLSRWTVKENIGSHKISGHSAEKDESGSSQHIGLLQSMHTIMLEDIYNDIGSKPVHFFIFVS